MGLTSAPVQVTNPLISTPKKGEALGQPGMAPTGVRVVGSTRCLAVHEGRVLPVLAAKSRILPFPSLPISPGFVCRTGFRSSPSM